MARLLTEQPFRPSSNMDKVIHSEETDVFNTNLTHFASKISMVRVLEVV
jgi:hypothetical protein